MTIIPAAKSTAAYFLNRALSDLLFWADATDPKPLPDDWAALSRDSIRSKTASFARAFQDSPEMVDQSRLCERMAVELVSLMANSPGLSAKPRHEWTVPSHCRLFDELAKMQDTFKGLADETEQKTPSEPAAASKPVETGSAAEHLEQPKIILPTNPDIAEVHNAIQAVDPATLNVSEICRTIAEKRGGNAEALRTAYNRWKRQNIG